MAYYYPGSFFKPTYPGMFFKPTELRCNIRGCKQLSAVAHDLPQCAAENCTKICHYFCYCEIILKSKPKKGQIMMTPLPNNKVACSKVCYFNITKSLSGSSNAISRGTSWTKDGINGVDDPNTSMKILLDWMLEDNNYSRYCGKSNDGVKKKQFATNLCEKMISLTNNKSRNALQVQAKISYIEDTFDNAYNFVISKTGVDIMEKFGKDTFQDMVRKKCHYYYELYPIMANRIETTEPKTTNISNLNDDHDKFSDDNDNTKEDDEADEYDEKKDANEDDDCTLMASNRSQQYRTTPTKNNDPEIEETGGTSITKRRSTTSTSKASSARKKLKKNKDSKSISNNRSLLDENNTLLMLNVQQSNKDNKLHEELVRHHHVIEKLEKKKLDLMIKKDVKEEEESRRLEEASWKDKNEKLLYQVNLVNQYMNLKDQQGLTKQQILQMFPEMHHVVETLEKE